MQAKTPKQKEADEVAQPKFGSYESMDPYNFPPV